MAEEGQGAAQAKFIRRDHRQTLLVSDTASDLITQLEIHEPPRVGKCLDFEPRDSS